MATTIIGWGDGSGDNIYLTYLMASGDQTVEVSSDANTGSARTKTVTFSASGVTPVTVTISQEASEPVPDHVCLTFRSTGSNTLSLTCNGTANPTLYYSTDGTTWTQWNFTALSITAGHPVFLYGSNTSGFSTSDTNFATFVMGGTGSVSCEGNISALINGTNTLNTIPNTYCFYSLFRNCTVLTAAPSLPSKGMKMYCYYSMFQGCSSLVHAPAIPATNTATQCFRTMFRDCTSLVSAPTLDVSSVASSAYRGMFYGCTSLTTAPDLPATTIGTYAYYQMFYGCTSLTTVPTTLPATTLQTACYDEMFRGCKNITTAPILPATTLVTTCYYRMFYNCSKLNYVKAMFTTTPTSGSNGTTTNWLYGVASSGTFVKNSAATWTNTGASSVPSGWTVQTASS